MKPTFFNLLLRTEIWFRNIKPQIKAFWRVDVQEGDAHDCMWWFCWGYIHPRNRKMRWLRWYFRIRFPIYSHHSQYSWHNDYLVTRWWQWVWFHAENLYPSNNSLHSHTFWGWSPTEDEATEIITGMEITRGKHGDSTG